MKLRKIVLAPSLVVAKMHARLRGWDEGDWVLVKTEQGLRREWSCFDDEEPEIVKLHDWEKGVARSLPEKLDGLLTRWREERVQREETRKMAQEAYAKKLASQFHRPSVSFGIAGDSAARAAGAMTKLGASFSMNGRSFIVDEVTPKGRSEFEIRAHEKKEGE